MGTDKGLIKLHANTWAQTAMDKLAGLPVPTLLSVSEVQYPDYLEVFSDQHLVKDNPDMDFHGPLAGVLSVHLQHPEDDLLVMACDMPLMEISMVKELLLLYQEQPSAAAFVFTNNNEPEPLCAIYTARGLAHVYQLWLAKQLTRHSMKFVLGHLHTVSAPLKDFQKKYFRNFNAHAELNGL